MKREVFTWVAILWISLLFFILPGSGIQVEAEAGIPSGTSIEESEFEDFIDERSSTF